MVLYANMLCHSLVLGFCCYLPFLAADDIGRLPTAERSRGRETEEKTNALLTLEDAIAAMLVVAAVLCGDQQL